MLSCLKIKADTHAGGCKTNLVNHLNFDPFGFARETIKARGWGGGGGGRAHFLSRRARFYADKRNSKLQLAIVN